jgi:hypothetical protein
MPKTRPGKEPPSALFTHVPRLQSLELGKALGRALGRALPRGAGKAPVQLLSASRKRLSRQSSLVQLRSRSKTPEVWEVREGGRGPLIKDDQRVKLKKDQVQRRQRLQRHERKQRRKLDFKPSETGKKESGLKPSGSRKFNNSKLSHSKRTKSHRRLF